MGQNHPKADKRLRFFNALILTSISKINISELFICIVEI